MIKLFFLYFIVINALGLFLMYSDKQKAKKGQYRISEAALWRTAIAGGAIGTTLGMNLFRHKTKHMSFKVGFPLLALIDILVAVFILFKSA